MRLIIIGITGAIGAALERAARSAGDPVVGCSRAGDGPRYIAYDVRNDDLTTAVPDIGANDRVVLLAAISDQNWVFRNPEAAWAVNVDAAARIADQAADIGCHLTALSSEAVFGADRDDGYGEEDMPNPTTEYGRQKAEMEDAVRRILPSAAIIRTGWNVAWSRTLRCPVRQTYESLLRNDAVMATDYLQTVTDIDDTASGVLAAARMRHAGILHLAATPPVSRSRLADIVIASSRHGPRMRYRPGRLSDIAFNEPRAARAWLRIGTAGSKFGMVFCDPVDTIRRKVEFLDRGDQQFDTPDGAEGTR